jgi:DNA-binding response OmpR family regulator
MIAAKVLIISDDAEMAQIWSYILIQKGVETSLITSPEDDSTERRPDYICDLVIIDKNAPQMNVPNLIRHLRTEVTAPVLLLLPSADELRVIEAYEAGGDEVIIKPISPRLIQAKVKAWMRRSGLVPNSMLDSFQVGDLRLEPSQRQLVTESNTVIKLTGLEFRLLLLLMSHPGQVMESSLIVDRLWGAHGDGDTTLLKNVVYRLRRKIEADPSQPRYLQVFPGEGYVFLPSHQE